MVYYGTDKTELIYFHLHGNEDDMHFVAMTQDCDENVFYVKSCCNTEWEWKFHYTATTYEMVKHAIFDIGFDSENMEEMLHALDECFEEIFDEIVIWDCECDGNCEHCDCNK